MDCQYDPELDLDGWNDVLKEQLGGRRYPLFGTMELTERCNLACVHCFINQPATSKTARSNELDTRQVFGILDQMAEAGCLFVVLTGGEALLRRDFLDIYMHAKRLGLLVTVFTNGVLLTPKIADALASYPPHLVEITLYGATPAVYEQVTRRPGSYARCMRAIELLLERGIRLALKSVLLQPNLAELSEMKAMAERLGLRYRYDGMLWPRLDGTYRPFDHRISFQELIALDYETPERRIEWDALAAAQSGRILRNEYVYNCGAGLRSFHIDSAGKMSICTMSRVPDFDLSQMSFLQAWEELGNLRHKKRQLHTACETCLIGGLCYQCPGWSQVVHGDDETPVDFICELGHLRYAQVQRGKIDG